MPGPPPTPTSLKLLRGNPGKRAINKDEPQPEPFDANPPAFLNDEALGEWRRLLPILQQMKVLTAADFGAFVNLCQAYSMKLEALRDIRERGQVVPSPQGEKANPSVKIYQDSMEAENRLQQQFGLTPASRGRVKVEPNKPGNPWAEVG